MTSLSLTRYNNNGIELLINTNTGESFASISGYARLTSVTRQAIQNRTKRIKHLQLETVEIETQQGIRSATLITEDLIVQWLPKDNPKLATQLLKLGVRKFLHQVAGFKINSAPKSRLELAKEQVKLIEEIERLEQQNFLQHHEIKILESDNQRQSEIIDELFDYSSIIRVAKFNDVSEKTFKWRQLKAASLKLNLEIKKAPCPRYGTKNLYHHRIWKLVYPSYQLPENVNIVVTSINE